MDLSTSYQVYCVSSFAHCSPTALITDGTLNHSPNLSAINAHESSRAFPGALRGHGRRWTKRPAANARRDGSGGKCLTYGKGTGMDGRLA